MRRSLTFYFRAVLIFLACLTSVPVISQPPSSELPSQISIQQAIHLLEQKHHIPVFYKTAWFTDTLVSVEIIFLPLNEALAGLAREQDLQVMPLRGMIFLVPSSSRPGDLSRPGDMLLVGNPNDYGRYSKVMVSGQISDGTTGEPLIGAVLYEPETGRGASTNHDGRFRMELPAGDIRLRVSYMGYEERLQDLRIFGPGDVDIDLFSSSTQLDEVTVMAKRAGENLESTRMGVVQLDARAIRELPVSFGERDIIRSLSLMPGVQTIGEFGTGFNVRGSSADQNLVLIENVPLFNSSHLFGLISVVNPEMVNSVSLIKGGTPARFGERASSVMDIKLGREQNAKEASLRGSLGVLNTGLLLEVPVVKDKIGLNLGGRFSNSDLFLKRMPAEDLLNSSAGFYDLTGFVKMTPENNNLITLFGHHTADRFSFEGETNYSYASTLASLRWSRSLGSNASTSLVLGFSNYRFETRDEPEINPTVHYKLHSALRYQTAKWNLGFMAFSNHNIELGVNAVRYEIDPGALSGLGSFSVIENDQLPGEQALELAAYLSDEIELSNTLSLQAGLRFSQYLQMGPGTVYLYQEGVPLAPETIVDSLFYGKNEVIASYGGLEPRLGLRMKTGPSSSLKFSFARINQYISLISSTSLMGPADLWKLSDTYLKPLRSDQVSLGFYKNLQENTIELSAEVYFKFLKNAFETKSGTEIAMNRHIETDMVNAKGLNYGMELLVAKPTGRLSGWASYTYSSSRLRTSSPFPESQINQNRSFPTHYDRPHNLVINAGINLTRRWRFGSTFTYSTGRPITLPEQSFQYDGSFLLHFSDRNKYRLPDYHRLDVSISLNENLRLASKGKSSFTFSVINLYGRKNPHSVFYKRNPGGLWGEQTFKLYQMFIIARPIPTLTLYFTL